MDITALLAMTAGRPGAMPRSDVGDPAAAADFAALLARAGSSGTGTANGAPAPLAKEPASGEAGSGLAALAQALDLEPEALAKQLDDAIAALAPKGELPETLTALATDTQDGELPEALAGLATDTQDGELPETLTALATDTQDGELPEALAMALDKALADLATDTQDGELPEALRPLADGLSEGQTPEALAPLLAALAERLGSTASAPAQATAPQGTASAQAMPQDPRLAEIAARLTLVAAPAASPDAPRPADGALRRLSSELAARRGEGAANAAAPGQAASLSVPQAGGERPAPLAPPLVAQAPLPGGEPVLDPGLSRAIGLEAGLPGASQGGAVAPQPGLFQGLSQGLAAQATAGLSTELTNLAARRGEGAANAAAPGQTASLSALQAGGERPAPLAPPLVAQAPLPSGEPALDPGLSRAIGLETGLPGASQGGAAAPQAGLSQGLSQGLPQGLPQGLATASLSAPVATQAWEQQLGQQLVGLAQRGGQVELHLHPAELGPLSVSLKLGDQGAQAQFLSAHAQVRQAVEQALPQLREALAEQGIQLADTSVGEQRGERHDGFLARGESGTPGGEPQGDETPALAGDSGRQAASLAASLRGGVDLFA